MTVYVIAQLKFKERESYNSYQAKFMGVFRNFNGMLLAADECPTVLEGDWPAEKFVMISFPDEESAIKFRESAQYQEIAVDRKRGADAVVLLVAGITHSKSAR